MKFSSFICFILLYISNGLFAQVAIPPAYTLHHHDLFSFIDNTAALVQMKQHILGVSMNRKFMMKELTDYRVGIGIKSGSGNFGLIAHVNSHPFYKNQSYQLGYGRYLGKRVDIGLGFRFHTISISGYGKVSKPGFGLGIIVHANDKLHTGVQLNNFLVGRSNQLKGNTAFSMGIGYEPSQKFLVSLQISKEEESLLNMVAGFQYRFISQLECMLSISSATSMVNVGFQLHTKKYRIGIISSVHPQLGISPGLNFIFKLRSSHAN